MKKVKLLSVPIVFVMVIILLAGCGGIATTSEQSKQEGKAVATQESNVEEKKVEEKKAVSINIGEYVSFGKYNGEPILWRCVDKSNGVMLVSVYILCQKAFDAAESGTARTGNTDVQNFGSNVWSNSNIREWLNSSSQTVSFTTQAPVESALYDGENAYADEPGFLSNFTKSERNKLKAVSHDGVTDKVYLLSEDEKIKGYFEAKGKFNFPESRAGISPLHFNTRTPSTSSPDGTRVVSEGNLSNSGACDGSSGVLPALNLRSEISTSKGDGSINSPYTIGGGNAPAATPVTKDKITVLINNVEVVFDQEPVIEEGRTLVPVRAIFDGLGLTVGWNGTTKTVTGKKQGLDISLTIGSKEAFVNGVLVTLDVPAKIINGVTFVPVMFIAESTGAKVDWDGEKKIVKISKK